MSSAPGPGGDANAGRSDGDATAASSSSSPSGQDLLHQGTLEAQPEQVSSGVYAEASSSQIAWASPTPPPSSAARSSSIPSPRSAATSSSRSSSAASIVSAAKQQRQASRVEALSPLSNEFGFQRMPPSSSSSSSSSSSASLAAASRASGGVVSLMDPLEALQQGEQSASHSDDGGRHNSDGESNKEWDPGLISVWVLSWA